MTQTIEAAHAESRKAFDDAIASGLLSADPKAPNYAGDYMFMGRRNGFKHIDTRNYLRGYVS